MDNENGDKLFAYIAIAAILIALGYQILYIIWKGFIQRSYYLFYFFNRQRRVIPVRLQANPPVIIPQDVFEEQHRVVIYVNQEENEMCSICLSDYEDLEELRVLNGCEHKFHKECVDKWLMEQSLVCPICRGPVVVKGGGNEDRIHIIIASDIDCT